MYFLSSALTEGLGRCAVLLLAGVGLRHEVVH